MRRAACVDANQAEIVRVLRETGATVQHLHAVGKGCPDILVGYRGENFLLEIKDGAKPPSKRKLTAQQRQWCRQWSGQWAVVTSPEDALRAMGAI